MKRKKLELKDYIEGINKKDVGILSRAISLIESRKKEDMQTAHQLLKHFYKEDGKAHRIGVTGTPGAGKSTFLNTFGMLFCENNHKIAILTIDPSSSISGGSILGDKTRMQEVSFHPNAYVRPSPSLGFLGGVAARTRETILLCEAFGFDTIFIESVGVGQSEQELSNMVDISLLLTITGGGDELQGIKRGLLEVADWILVNKADGDNKQKAIQARNEIRSALQILKQEDFFCEAITSLDSKSLVGIYEKLLKSLKEKSKSGETKAKRNYQKQEWFHKMIEQKALIEFYSDPDRIKNIEKLSLEVKNQTKHPLEIIEKV